LKIILTGATGFIGKALFSHLALHGHEVVPLKRDTRSSAKTFSDEELEKIRGAHAVVHLAGEPIAAKRWTDKAKKQIFDSRIQSTRQIVEAIEKFEAAARPKVMVCASAIGFYGDRRDEELTEDSDSGTGFLADVVKAWEQAAAHAEKHGVRVVRIRNGHVLGRGGGILAKMKPIVLGSGKQWMSWVHLNDVMRFIEFAIDTESLSGAFNLTSPNPVTNIEFAKSLARYTGAIVVLHVPALLLKIALGEMASILLESSKALPTRTLQSGFRFEYEVLAPALQEVFDSDSPRFK
jgi:uncharacterized protein (TIGR01777 family)